jgi:hypothetical protein
MDNYQDKPGKQRNEMLRERSGMDVRICMPRVLACLQHALISFCFSAQSKVHKRQNEYYCDSDGDANVL